MWLNFAGTWQETDDSVLRQIGLIKGWFRAVQGAEGILAKDPETLSIL